LESNKCLVSREQSVDFPLPAIPNSITQIGFRAFISDVEEVGEEVDGSDSSVEAIFDDFN
jgi:hypothetical protein